MVSVFLLSSDDSALSLFSHSGFFGIKTRTNSPMIFKVTGLIPMRSQPFIFGAKKGKY